uniref:2-dehydropantoate 2-reductase n=1 Tax=Aureoumbra lagunensis TaxID=44058 RepID=A0A7S3NM78_9STRA|mmetsp:Transcript_4205/g.5913  ORF Transcript_4205/g.5913 Transcript_4205/m.5913 type:complete len:335 (+) Transcript_4205:39-1043(+)
MTPAPIYNIIGAGALGTMVAAKMAQAGIDIRLIVRDGSMKHAIAKQHRGGIVRIVVDDDEGIDVEVATSPKRNALSSDPSRYVLCTKAYDAKTGVSVCEPGARVITLCNGSLALRSALNGLNLELVRATTTHGCWEKSPFEIVHAGFGRIWISSDDAGGLEMAQHFKRAGLGAIPLSASEMDNRLWSKLAANCVLNPITALLACNNGNALPRAEPLARRVCTEIANLRFTSFTFDNTHVQTYANRLYEDVAECARENANNFSSMFQDLRHGRRTEIDFLNGWVASASAQANPPLSAPANLKLAMAIRNKSKFPAHPSYLLNDLLSDSLLADNDR